jgi:hypothetical protein
MAESIVCPRIELLNAHVTALAKIAVLHLAKLVKLLVVNTSPDSRVQLAHMKVHNREQFSFELLHVVLNKGVVEPEVFLLRPVFEHLLSFFNYFPRLRDDSADLRSEGETVLLSFEQPLVHCLSLSSHYLSH